MKKLLILTTTFLALSNSYAATNYYLDATNGNNSYSGTSLEIPMECTSNCIGPWKTKDAIDKFSDPLDPLYVGGFEPGDNILFKKGENFIFTKGLTFQDSGERTKPITFSSYGEGDKPVLEMSGWPIVGYLWTNDKDGDGHDDEDGIWFYSYSGQVVAGFWEDGIHLKHDSDPALPNGQFHWDKGNGIYYKPPYPSTPDDHELYKTGAGYGIAIENLKNLVFSDLHFKTGPHAIGGTAKDSPIENILIENCQFDNLHSPIYLASRNGNENRSITITNNVFNSQFRAVAIVAASNGPEQNYNIDINNNTITDLDANGNYLLFVKKAGTAPDHEALSIQNIMNSSITDNTIISNPDNIIKDSSDGAGISMWTNALSTFNNNIIARNTISKVAVGITLFSSNTYNSHIGNRVYQNIIYDCTHDDSMASSSSVGAFRLSGDDSPGSNLVYNNTIANCGTSFYLFVSEGFTIVNNLSISPIDRHIWYYGNIGANKIPIMDNNLYFHHQDNMQFRHGGGVTADISFDNSDGNNGWQELSNQDVNSFVAYPSTPIVIDEENKDFHLTSESLAIDAGVKLGTRTDFDGNRIKKYPDIGAYEYH